MSNSVRPQRRQPTRLCCPWDSPGKNTGVGCHFLLQCMKVKRESEVTESHPTLRDPMNCSLPVFSVHEIFQARVLEWGAIAFSDMRQQKRHRCIAQNFGLCRRGRGWDDLEEWHWNMYNIIYETNRQSRFDAGYRMLGADALGWPRGMVQGGRWEGASGWETRVHPWQIHINVWQNQCSIVK